MVMTPEQIKREIDLLMVDNKTNDIEASEQNTLFTHMNNAYEPKAVPGPPTVLSFSIQNQPLFVDPGTVLSGSATFLYNISNPADVDGNASIKQGAATLANDVDPTLTSRVLNLNTRTLNAGESETFEIDGTDINLNNFIQQFVVTARVDSDYAYVWTSLTSNSSVFPGVGSADVARSPLVDGSQNLIVPSYVGANRFIYVAQPSSDPDISDILIGGASQFGAFTETIAAITINAVNYDVFVSENAQAAATTPGEIITIVR